MNYLILVNKNNKILKNYINEVSLIEVINFEGERCLIEKKTYESYIRMKEFLLTKGIDIDIDEGYRSIKQQESLHAKFSSKYGKSYADKIVAEPFTSEHHTALAIDLAIKSNGTYCNDNDKLINEFTHEFDFIHSILSNFGFILRYPKGKENITGYPYEPWHIRYVGKYAKEIYSKNITLEEFISNRSKIIEYLKKYYKGNINDAIKRLEEGEPAQYIVGNVDFYGYTIQVDKRVLIPRRETEELVEEVIKRSSDFDDPTIIDVGTGSGAISISLSKKLNKKVYASDISSDALDVAIKNVKINKANVILLKGDMLKPYIDNNIKVDIIVSNPPYIKEDEDIEDIVKNNEPNIALYAKNNGLEFYESILKDAHKILKNKYLIAFEIGKTQSSDIQNLVHKYIKDAKVEIKKDLSLNDRMLFVYNI